MGNDTPVSCLVDSSTTHTFIAAEVFTQLGLQPVPAEQLEVTLAEESVFVQSETKVFGGKAVKQHNLSW